VISARLFATPALVLAALLTSLPGVAQVSSGALYGVVLDGEGAPVCGATVSLDGEQGARRVQITNARGEFRFADLDPGLYQGKVEQAGFSTNEYPDIPVHLGGTTTIDVALIPADDDSITLTAECPLLDERKISSGATLTREELETLPTARDPWAILQQAPGVLLDRVGVGPSESGHPAVARAPGSTSEQNAVFVDGVPITDPEAPATTPVFHDFASFEQMQVTTGGTDASVATGGVVLNMVTRAGSNAWRGAGRYLLSDGDWQPSPDQLDLAAGQDRFEISPGFERSAEHGADLGGALVEERLWIWGSYNRSRVDRRRDPSLPALFDEAPGERDAENGAAKLDVALGAGNRLQLFAHRGEAQVEEIGVGPTRSVAAAWDLDAPTTLWKLEDAHAFRAGLFVSAQLSGVDARRDLMPRGAAPTAVLGADGVFRDTFLALASERERGEARVDASVFFDAGSIGHEIKTGALRRRDQVRSASHWGTEHSVLAEHPSGAGALTRFFFRPDASDVELDLTSFYVQDTLAIGDLSADVGVRYDLARGERAAQVLAANPLRPDLVPAIALPATDAGFEWESIVPRVGLTWALGEERATFLRASFSRFADPLGTAFFPQAVGAPDASPFTFSAVRFLDLDGDRLVDPAEPQVAAHGTLAGTVIDPALEAPMLDELTFGVEHAGAGCFSVGGRFSWRRRSDLLDERPFVRDAAGAVRVATAADYVADGTATGRRPDGSTYGVPTFALHPELEALATRFLTNGAREVEYLGATVWLERRLKERWQLRGFANVRDEETIVPEDALRLDDPTDAFGFEDDDAAPFGPPSVFPDKSDVRLHSSWDYSVAGLYRARFGFTAAVLAHGREGYPLLYFEGVEGSDGLFRRVAVTDEENPARLDDVHQVDVRLAKELRLGEATVTLSADAFNLLNETPALQRGAQLETPTADFLREIVSPRILRLGVQIALR